MGNGIKELGVNVAESLLMTLGLSFFFGLGHDLNERLVRGQSMHTDICTKMSQMKNG